jgi:hypothetical protein
MRKTRSLACFLTSPTRTEGHFTSLFFDEDESDEDESDEDESDEDESDEDENSRILNNKTKQNKTKAKKHPNKTSKNSIKMAREKAVTATRLSNQIINDTTKQSMPLPLFMEKTTSFFPTAAKNGCQTRDIGFSRSIACSVDPTQSTLSN